ncbi:uncharacterized protein TRIADDRAFT_53065 [Trichoplax adhaerens]|uniref:SH3 domain-containing protein n=1 Tax=Trichoplax adhaerens TaxID=10228 RepID=B3RN74_TRIAD|nr:hypothetical protein TRIADDRAFT_53065 [Trichoplax adhaerens]EDV27971.1 hypothetical protein TRIADDRAFT_53065 [Trichoplax adhaerens]|eukprot:XP_002109805.1 hypothetical protein TRIADDRAFT_53065 [Trichoplax adhaerens]
MDLTWSSQLLGDTDALGKHTAAAVDFVDRIANFVKKKSNLESMYAKDLRKLIKSAKGRQMKDDFLEGRGTAIMAFNNLINETENIASEHELMVDQLHTTDIGAIKSQLESHYKAAETSKKNYERACREAEIATKTFHNAEADTKSTKAQLDKMRNTAASKAKAAEDSKIETKEKLCQANERKALHYGTYLPDILKDMQRCDINRTNEISKYLSEYIEVYKNNLPSLSNIYDKMTTIQQSIDAEKDAEMVASENGSDFVLPEDLVFEEYKENSNREINKLSIAAGFSVVTGLFSKKKKEDDKDYEAYPPEKKKKKALTKITELETALEQLNRNRNGALKLYNAYSENPNYGDVNKVKKELIYLAREINQKNTERYNLQVMIADIDKLLPPDFPKMIPEDSVECDTRSDTSDMGSTMANDISSSNNELIVKKDNTDIANFTSDYRICKALYDFDGTSSGELTVFEGTQMFVLEEDTGQTGWTKVQINEDIGYVPTAYIEYI